MPETRDPSRTNLFYYAIALASSIIASLVGYALLRLTLQGQGIIALETWKDIQIKDFVRDNGILYQLRDLAHDNQASIKDIDEQLRFLKNGLTFHEAQISYIISWDKRMREQEDPQMRKYPR